MQPSAINMGDNHCDDIKKFTTELILSAIPQVHIRKYNCKCKYITNNTVIMSLKVMSFNCFEKCLNWNPIIGILTI